MTTPVSRLARRSAGARGKGTADEPDGRPGRKPVTRSPGRVRAEDRPVNRGDTGPRRTSPARRPATAAIKITRPREVAKYAAMFEHLRAEAIHGNQARQLIATLLAQL